MAIFILKWNLNGNGLVLLPCIHGLKWLPVDTDNVTRFQRKERMPTRTIFSDTHFKYDADFWGEFNVIPWEEELGTVIEKLSSKIEQIEY